SMPDVTKALLDGKVTALAYELVQTVDGKLPLLEPMSEVAGKLSVLNGSTALLSQHGGRGILLGGAVGVEPAEVVIIGAGTAGKAAAEIASGMGAKVTILDISHDKLEAVKHQFQGRVQGLYSTKASLERTCQHADLLIGAVLIPGAAAPKLITRQVMRSMKSGSVFVDISVDQGGCAETTKPTSLENPYYQEEGVIHYAVPNMPAQTPRTSTMALTSATLPYIKRIANMGLLASLERSAKHNDLREALNTMDGRLANKAVSEATGFGYYPIDSLI
ncbi:MAG: alanine dehydrogenase, partial [Deltaproteobacteria bacterium]|nr:alanine dehydrogenase [Deltaproteobacteria bacterium]